ncbi:hypothetical protein NNC19_18595 [Clostridium sp. SHJSY1]|uniref:hypothetical protein n=1 Tax=Clostridium sp. SHJSY1 TaxID=2942483 RepID=UPI002874CCEB|nr:hypothetical protein [Clostridium sp. SHJSY1]MDS0527702.1 hypothetical protein [Clostridium sp. SHJSY1]
MNRDENYELLKYQIKLLQIMICSVTDDDKYMFYNFVIDHNISERKTNVILKSLGVLKDRILENEVSSEIKELCEGIEPLNDLFINKEPSFNEYNDFIRKYISKEFEARYLLLALKRQGIYIEVCNYLLKDMESNI